MNAFKWNFTFIKLMIGYSLILDIDKQVSLVQLQAHKQWLGVHL